MFRVVFSEDGRRLVTTALSSDRTTTVKVWETAPIQEIFEIREMGTVPFFAAFDPTGRYLVREGPEHAVQVRDAQNGEVVGVVGRHDRQIWSMVFSPDRQHLATASNDGTVRVWVWDPEHLGPEQRPLMKLPVRLGGYGDRLAYSSDSLHLATGGERHSVQIWNAKTGEAEHSLPGHTGDVFALAFSRDGRWLASAGEDTTIRVWDARSWTLLHTLRGHTGVINGLAFSPDGRQLASASRDRTMKIWDTARWNEPSGY
jgi:WD40 repeat protein